MKSTGDELFEKNAHTMLRDIGMEYLPIASGADLDAVRWSLTHRALPQGRREAWLEQEAPELLAYLECIDRHGAAGWRTANERVELVASVFRQNCGLPECRRPWLRYLWNTLPEMASIGRMILDRQSDELCEFSLADKAFAAEDVARYGENDGGEGSSGKVGSAGTVAVPKPTPRRNLRLRQVPVLLTVLEREILGLKDESKSAKPKIDGPSGTDGPGGTDGPKVTGKKGGPK
ncbi:hypothetical protein [Rhizobium sp. C4]|uniref:hypothetical protein n=1 Tax=Rhizobium sp. C4 TaxID=1349800 RepID=UPI001E50756F|nr:hypothetical protein [Rhizobium sp. C4]MCD2175349.1 hypothetical protein [Rhizobium sp. C4]